jgi:hypothetical protein
MLLDAVLADRRHGWLGTEQDKRTYFREALEYELPDDRYPHLTFGAGTAKTRRFFPDKLPIGVPRRGEERHVFLYLATREVPSDFRMFLLTHADLLTGVDEWTIRVIVPRRFHKAAALYRYSFRDAFGMPLEPRETEELEWYFQARDGELVCPSPDPDLDLPTARRKYSAARFEALYRVWQQRGEQALWSARATTFRERLQRGIGRLEFVDLRRQYLQLPPLVGQRDVAEKDLNE